MNPLLWEFNENLNSVNPLTLGNFFKGKKKTKIDFTEFRKNVYVRTIRGNESLEQQIYFFKDIFVSKISQKINKLENKINFLENYQQWLGQDNILKIIDEYSNLQGNYQDQLNNNNNLDNTIRGREENLRKSEKVLELLEKLIFINENDIEALRDKKLNEEKNAAKIDQEIKHNHAKLTDIEQKLNDLKNQFDENTKKELQKLNVQKKQLKEQIISEYKIEPEIIDNANDETKTKEIENQIELFGSKIKEYKETIEKLNKQNERILAINNFITQLRDICSKASSHEFGQEKLFKFKSDRIKDLSLSFEDLFKNFQENNLIFKQDEELKRYVNQVQVFNEEINLNRKKLSTLRKYNEILQKINLTEKKIKGDTSKIDDYIDLETRLEKLENEKKEVSSKNENLKKDLFNYNKNIEDLTNLIAEINENPSQTVVTNDLKKLGIGFNQKATIIDDAKKEISQIQNQLNENTEKLAQMRLKQNETRENIEKLREDLNPLSIEIQKKAKEHGFAQIGPFIDYYKSHIDKFTKYFENTKNLYKRLEILKADIGKILEGVKPKNKAHLSIINSEFDHIFKEIYDKKEFFDYVFKDYSKIKKFDIVNKNLIFETHSGLEEIRDLEEFSSGEKTYAYCRSIISMTENVAKYNIVILDESYALLDQDHSQNLYKFQQEMIQQKNITKFINILPLKVNFEGLINDITNNIKEEEKKSNSSIINSLTSQLETLKTFQNEITNNYYQEIHYPEEKRRELNLSLGIMNPFATLDNVDVSNAPDHAFDLEEKELEFSFVLDGSNIARNNPNSKNASIRDVIKLQEKLINLGVPEEHIIIIFGSGLRHYISEREKSLYQDLLTKRNVNQAPAGENDDWFIIKYAFDHKSYMISNDLFREFKAKSPEMESFIETHSIHYSVIRNDIVFGEGFDQRLKNIMKI
ncbi:MAG: hypothetical protein JW891_04150 [Candidatus Lokiarchaeota archaeon]|nr:hypothetical protein [Candidatus Lokiarchaeota archaeon]